MAVRKDFYVYYHGNDDMRGEFTEKQAKEECMMLIEEGQSEVDNLEILRRWAIPKDSKIEFDYINWE